MKKKQKHRNLFDQNFRYFDNIGFFPGKKKL